MIPALIYIIAYVFANQSNTHKTSYNQNQKIIRLNQISRMMKGKHVDMDQRVESSNEETKDKRNLCLSNIISTLDNECYFPDASSTLSKSSEEQIPCTIIVEPIDVDNVMYKEDEFVSYEDFYSEELPQNMDILEDDVYEEFYNEELPQNMDILEDDVYEEFYNEELPVNEGKSIDVVYDTFIRQDDIKSYIRSNTPLDGDVALFNVINPPSITQVASIITFTRIVTVQINSFNDTTSSLFASVDSERTITRIAIPTVSSSLNGSTVTVTLGSSTIPFASSSPNGSTVTVTLISSTIPIVSTPLNSSTVTVTLISSTIPTVSSTPNDSTVIVTVVSSTIPTVSSTPGNSTVTVTLTTSNNISTSSTPVITITFFSLGGESSTSSSTLSDTSIPPSIVFTPFALPLPSTTSINTSTNTNILFSLDETITSTSTSTIVVISTQTVTSTISRVQTSTSVVVLNRPDPRSTLFDSVNYIPEIQRVNPTVVGDFDNGIYGRMNFDPIKMTYSNEIIDYELGIRYLFFFNIVNREYCYERSDLHSKSEKKCCYAYKKGYGYF